MPRVTCRCGERLKLDSREPERVDCPKCGARIRLRRSSKRNNPEVMLAGDGFIRFSCPCGRRLKVTAKDRPEAGKCPDCGRVVPVPESARSGDSNAASGPPNPEARTDELDAVDVAMLKTWSARFADKPPKPATGSTTSDLMSIVPGDELKYLANPPSPPPSAVKFEAGLRVCPRCNKPVHLSASHCRECGTPIPRP